MTVTVASRTNHYEALGVSPTATADEIARAFAREGAVFRPHAFGVLTELCIAYETLRDPIKRRAYDAGLGLFPQNRSIGAREVRPEPTAPTAAPASIAAMPLPLARPTASQITPPEAKPVLSRGSDPEFTADPHLFLAETPGVDARPLDLRRPAIALGTIVAAACTLGALVGYWSSRDVSAATQAAKPVSVSLPAARRQAIPAEPVIAAAPVESMAESRPAPAKRAAFTAAPIEPKRLDPEPAAVEAPTLPSQDDLGPIEQAASEEPVAPAPASLPLSNRVIARTIERIGYSCGSVSSAVPVEGEAPGIYKINCSSGQSYKAGPVNGRYRFRRWSKS